MHQFGSYLKERKVHGFIGFELWYNLFMNIFKNYTYSWWQVGILKLALLSFGLAVGAYWHEVFSQYITLFVLIGVVCAVYIGFVSLKK